ncbi:cilia- and flagella-associated protein 300 isoform X1 [Sardina pilchardus]|uniref:cilia- and flagella-associated protein 300 isoform X1 n=1 Tax=Sardina pilchardus TaxID=27697 RepID=UPI002E14BEAF
MAGEQITFDQKYVFNLLSSKNFPFLQNPEISRRFLKWSMLGRISAQAFNFDQIFYPYKKDEFVLVSVILEWVRCNNSIRKCLSKKHFLRLYLCFYMKDFFQDPCVTENLKVLQSGYWTSLGNKVTRVDVEVIPCSKVSMDIFDPLHSGGVLRPSGHIVKCYHDIYGDFDELRNVLTIEDSDKYDLIRPADREEFIFKLFKHICLGGELCQYEDSINPYLDTVKVIYKDLVSVQKDRETKQINIASTILKVSTYDASGLCYPDSLNSEQSFAYLCVDPLKRHVYVLYHSFGTGHLSCAGMPHS